MPRKTSPRRNRNPPPDPTRSRLHRPPLTIREILGWADAWFAEHGDWPYHDSGPIPQADDLTWRAVEAALRTGGRGLPGHSSLNDLLARRRGVKLNSEGRRPSRRKPRRQLTLKQIRAWAVEHFKKTGEWPHYRSGAVISQPDLTWEFINSALYAGQRGLPAGHSLTRLFGRKRSAPRRSRVIRSR